MKFNHSFLQLTIVHIKEYFREPAALFWSFGFPILMAIGLGIAFSKNTEIIHSVAVVEQHQAEVKSLVEKITPQQISNDTIIEKSFKKKLGNTKYRFYFRSWDDAILLLKKGTINVIVTEKRDGVTFHYDPLNPEGELIQMQLTSFINEGTIGDFSDSMVALETKGTRYIDFLIPGLLTFGIMMSVMWGICYSLIEKRSKKLLRRMIATPMNKAHYLMSHWLSRIILTAIETIVLIIFAHYFFHVEIQGSMLALILLFVSGNLSFFGLAILLSSRTDNTQVGNGLISFTTTPMMVLSGVFFSYHNFPGWAVNIIKWLPLTKFTDEVRSVFNESAGLAQTMDGILILTGFGFICFAAGLKIYKWF